MLFINKFMYKLRETKIKFKIKTKVKFHDYFFLNKRQFFVNLNKSSVTYYPIVKINLPKKEVPIKIFALTLILKYIKKFQVDLKTVSRQNTYYMFRNEWYLLNAENDPEIRHFYMERRVLREIGEIKYYMVFLRCYYKSEGSLNYENVNMNNFYYCFDRSFILNTDEEYGSLFYVVNTPIQK